jgi:hypothetical protein
VTSLVGDGAIPKPMATVQSHGIGHLISGAAHHFFAADRGPNILFFLG